MFSKANFARHWQSKLAEPLLTTGSKAAGGHAGNLPAPRDVRTVLRHAPALSAVPTSLSFLAIPFIAVGGRFATSTLIFVSLSVGQKGQMSTSFALIPTVFFISFVCLYQDNPLPPFQLEAILSRPPLLHSDQTSMGPGPPASTVLNLVMHLD